MPMPNKIHKDEQGRLYFRFQNGVYRPEASTYTEGLGNYPTKAQDGDPVMSPYYNGPHCVGFKTSSKPGTTYEIWRFHGFCINPNRPPQSVWSPAAIAPPTLSFADFSALLGKYRPGTSNKVSLQQGKWAVVASSTLGWEIIGATYEEAEAYLKAHPQTEQDQMDAFGKMLKQFGFPSS